MQMRVDKLRETLGLLRPVVPRKANLAVLENVLLKDGEAVATDLETAVVLKLAEAEGECLVPHRSVSELLRYVPGNELLTLQAEEKSLKLTWRGGGATYDVPQVADYPPVPQVKAKAEGVVDGDSLVKALVAVAPYCATAQDRPVLTGVTVLFGESLQVAAGDGFRMACQTLASSFGGEETVVIPAHAVGVLGYLWDKVPAAAPLEDSLIRQVTAKREIELALGEESLTARFGEASLTTRLIQGTPPTYRQLIPQETAFKVQVFGPELERAVRRIRGLARDSSGIVRLAWKDSTLTVSAKGDEKGKVEQEVPTKTDGGPGRVALNVGYLLDYLKGKDGVVTVALAGESTPVLFRHGASPLVLVMPMHVQW